MVAKNYPKPVKIEGPFQKYRNVNIYLTAELFNEVREVGLAEQRSFSNTITILIQRGLKARRDVPQQQ